MVIWSAAFPIEISDLMITATTYCWICTYPTAKNGNWETINAVDIVVLIWGAIMIVLSAFLAFKVIVKSILSIL